MKHKLIGMEKNQGFYIVFQFHTVSTEILVISETLYSIMMSTYPNQQKPFLYLEITQRTLE